MLLNPWVGKIPWRRARQPTPVSLPEESHGERSLVGFSPWGRKESDTTPHLNNNKRQVFIKSFYEIGFEREEGDWLSALGGLKGAEERVKSGQKVDTGRTKSKPCMASLQCRQDHHPDANLLKEIHEKG